MNDDFYEALYVLSLDRERLDIVRQLHGVNFDARIGLDDASDLSPTGLDIYHALVRLFALVDSKKPTITVISRAPRCQDVANEAPLPKFATLEPSGATQRRDLTTEAPRDFAAL